MIKIADMQNIYLEYANQVKKFLFCMTKNYDLSEELTQETFYQAYKSINRYNGNCKISVWLCQIAKHLYYDYLKKNKNYNCVSLDDGLTNIIDSLSTDNLVENQMIETEQTKEIIKIIEKLGEPYNKVFLLRTLGELSFHEIGNIFDKSENWARVTYYRAKVKLSERMELYGNDL